MSTPQNMPDPTQPAAAEQQPAKKKRSPVKLIISILVPLAVIGFGVYGYFNSVGSSSKVGDCLAGQITDDPKSADSIKKADCGPGATYKIVGRIEDKKQTEAGADGAICQPFPAAQYVYWEGTRGGNGNFLCLETLKP
ncbi:hypothetical protein GCM10022247_60760 [Allokutzneria multivorans]|uniref:Uncharacterized protein n=1 Tax=Allokutzneria multivorans TaxID=1142134 RepID=A0ABP7TL32_9PSEU